MYYLCFDIRLLLYFIYLQFGQAVRIATYSGTMDLYFRQIPINLNKSNRPVGLAMQILGEMMSIYGYQIPIVCDEYSNLKAIPFPKHKRMGEIQFLTAPSTIHACIPHNGLGTKSRIDVQCDVIGIVPI